MMQILHMTQTSPFFCEFSRHFEFVVVVVGFMTPAEIEAWYVNRRMQICQLGACSYICCSGIRITDSSDVCLTSKSSTCPSRVGFLTRDDFDCLRDPNDREGFPQVNDDTETHNCVIQYLKGFEDRYHRIYIQGTTIALASAPLISLAMLCIFDQTACQFLECEWTLAAKIEAFVMGLSLMCCFCLPLPFILACMFVIPSRTGMRLIFNYNKAVAAAIPPTVMPCRLSAIVSGFLAPGGYFVTADCVTKGQVIDRDPEEGGIFAMDWMNSLFYGQLRPPREFEGLK